MTTEPIYTALVAEGFDPAMVPPNSTRAERKIDHERWWAKTQAMKPKPLKLVRPRKVAAK